ncbi:MAG TPA: hypothetical protein VGM94_18545, partial [Galbitalea sp.]
SSTRTHRPSVLMVEALMGWDGEPCECADCNCPNPGAARRGARFSAPMQEMGRKVAHAQASYTLRSRAPDGRANP